MAGIGFALRKLLKRETLSSFVGAHLHAAFASCGPWLFTLPFFIGTDHLIDFSIGTVFASPFILILTRYLADLSYQDNLKNGAGALFGTLSLFYLLVLPLGLPFDVLSALGICLCTPFISLLKNYKGVTLAFLLSLLFGLPFTLTALIGLIIYEFPKGVHAPYHFLIYFRTHYELALIGTLFTLAFWCDKWINPDTTYFGAHLTLIPAMALFTLTEETRFYETYKNYFNTIKTHGTLDEILEACSQMKETLLDIGKRLLLLQLAVSITILLVSSSRLLKWGVLSSSFLAFTLFMSIILLYFDRRKEALKIQALFLFTNLLFTFLFPPGIGYLTATFLTFLYTLIITARFIEKIPYYTFNSR